MIYADFSFYETVYHGNAIPDSDFCVLATRASEYLDYYTAGRTAKYADKWPVEIGKACCAIAEIYQKYDKLDASVITMQSQTVGSWSATYRSADDVSATYRRQMADAARRYLMSTGLLYRGVC